MFWSNLLYLNTRTAAKILIYPFKSLLAVLVASDFPYFLCWLLVVLGPTKNFIDCWNLCPSACRKCWYDLNIVLQCFHPSRSCFLQDHPCSKNLGLFKVVLKTSSVSLWICSMFQVKAYPVIGLQEDSVILRYSFLAVKQLFSLTWFVEYIVAVVIRVFEVSRFLKIWRVKNLSFSWTSQTYDQLGLLIFQKRWILNIVPLNQAVNPKTYEKDSKWSGFE